MRHKKHGNRYGNKPSSWVNPPTASPDLKDLSDKELYHFALKSDKVTVLENELLHRLERFLEVEDLF